jgi:hypothetical protein
VRCIEPGATTPEDLVAFTDGASADAVRRHLERCAACAAEIAAYGRTQARLRRLFARLDCPAADSLGEYALGLAAEADRMELARHVVACPRCKEELDSFRAFLADEPVATPPSVGLLDRMFRLIATAVLPSPRVAVGALRGVSERSSQVYEAGPVGISIDQTRESPDAGITVTGLVWHTDEPDAGLAGEALLVRSDGITSTTPIDEGGNFVFESVVDGAYALEVRTTLRVVVENLHIEA